AAGRNVQSFKHCIKLVNVKSEDRLYQLAILSVRFAVWLVMRKVRRCYQERAVHVFAYSVCYSLAKVKRGVDVLHPENHGHYAKARLDVLQEWQLHLEAM